MSQMGMPIALALLEGPTKAVVASAFTAAGLGSTLLAFSPNTALCFTYRQAYDDDVFKSAAGSKDGAPDFSTPYDINKDSSAPYIKKLRPVGYDALEKIAGTRNITWTLSRNVAVSSLLTINRYIGLLYEAEEQAAATGEDPIYPPFPEKELRHSVKVGCINACLDWATQMMRSVLDWIAANNLTLTLSRRIRKDLRASAVRKDHYRFYSRAPRVARTCLFSESTLYLADWFITCCLEMYNALLRKPTAQEIIAARGVIYPRSTKLRLLAVRCGLQLCRCTAVWLAISTGNGIGSAAPIKYRGITMFLCAQLAGMGTNLYMNAFIARFTAGVGPPEGPPPFVGPPQPPPAPLAPSPAAAAAGGAAEEEVNGEASGDAAMHALHDLLGNFQPQVLPFGGDDGGEAALGNVQEPAAPELPEAHQNQEARPRGGPRLPQRRPRRNNAGVRPENAAGGEGGAGGQNNVPGPDTPQSARDPPRVVAAEDRAEGEGAERGEEPAVEREEEAVEEAVEGVGVDEALMPPATPPAADDGGARDE